MANKGWFVSVCPTGDGEEISFTAVSDSDTVSYDEIKCFRRLEAMINKGAEVKAAIDLGKKIGGLTCFELTVTKK